MALARACCNVHAHFVFNKVLCKELQTKTSILLREAHSKECTTATISLFKAYTW